MKVYVIIDNVEESAEIQGVFSSQDKAKRYLLDVHGYDIDDPAQAARDEMYEHVIEEWEVN